MSYFKGFRMFVDDQRKPYWHTFHKKHGKRLAHSGRKFQRPAGVGAVRILGHTRKEGT